MTNLERFNSAVAKSPLQRRLAMHGNKGRTKMWFPEYAVMNPQNVIWPPADPNKRLLSVKQEFRQHFCDFLDQKQRDRLKREDVIAQIQTEKFQDAPGDLPNLSTTEHGALLNRLTYARLHPYLYDKFKKAKPHAIALLHLKHEFVPEFQRYALWCLARLAEATIGIEKAMEADVEKFSRLLEKARQDFIDKRDEEKRRGMEIHKRNTEVTQKRRDALLERKNWLRGWSEKYASLFPPDSTSPGKVHRKTVCRLGRKEDPDVKALETLIRTQPGRCHWCWKKLPYGATVDHVIPLVKGGKHVSSNLVASCLRCNVDKGTLLPEDFLPCYTDPS